MSKHSKRDRKNDLGNSGFGFNMKNNPFGIDPAQLIGILGNLDMGNFNYILSNMNKNGVDINSVNSNYQSRGDGNISNGNSTNMGSSNLNLFGNMMGLTGIKNGNFDMNALNSFAEKMGIGNNKFTDTKNDSKQSNHSGEEKLKDLKAEYNSDDTKEGFYDENYQLLLSIRNIVDSNKRVFIDKIIEKYKAGDFLGE